MIKIIVDKEQEMIKIIVDTEQEKRELLEASEHIHYADIDTDIPMVNFIAHLYLAPELIKVKE